MKKSQLIRSLVAALFVGFAGYAVADPTLRQIAVGAQVPQIATPGGQAYFPVAITRFGTGSMNVLMSVSGLPAGATGSFVPPEVSFTDLGPSTKTTKLLIRIPANTPQGSYPFVITARKGNSPNLINSTNTLVIGPGQVVIQVPTLNPPVLQPDGTLLLTGTGTANQPVLVEATTDLGTGVWQALDVQLASPDGIFSLIDQDVQLYPMRFYRVSQ